MILGFTDTSGHMLRSFPSEHPSGCSLFGDPCFSFEIHSIILHHFPRFYEKKMGKINNVIPHCFLAVAASMAYTLGMMHDVACELHFAVRMCTNHNIGLYRHPLKTDILSSCTSAYLSLQIHVTVPSTVK